MGVWAAGAAVILLIFGGIYLLVRRNSKQASKLGEAESREEIYRKAVEKACRAAEVRARPRRTPRELLAWMRKRASGRPPDNTSLPGV